MGERRRAFYKMADPLNFTNRFGVVVQVINFYFQMLAERDELFVIAGELPKGCHFFHTSFISCLSTGGFDGVQTWTRKVICAVRSID
jgi:Ulp1 family protease